MKPLEAHEPILNSPHFPQILRLWKVLATHYQYLDLPDTFDQLSLYELEQHITHPKTTTALVTQIIRALTNKVIPSEKSKKGHTTILQFARDSKYSCFDTLLQTSPYQLSLNEASVLLSLQETMDADLPIDKQFHELSVKSRLTYLSILTDMVTTSTAFKKTYIENLKADYKSALDAEPNAPANKAIKPHFLIKLANVHSAFIGRDSRNNAYFYVPKINDSVFVCDLKTKNWKRIKGLERVWEITDQIIENRDPNTSNETFLIERIYDLKVSLKWDMEIHAFDKTKKLFRLEEEPIKPDLKQILSKRMHDLDHEYTKFIGDCFNFRWATKKRRIDYHKEIDKAESLRDLLGCFGAFFNETKQQSFKKIDTLDFYDYRLETEDQDIEQFKHVYLGKNYLYSRPVTKASEDSNDKKSITLQHQIQYVLENLKQFEHVIFEYLFVFVESMIGIINQLYPSMYQKRLKQIRTLAEARKKKEEEEEKNAKKRNLTKNGKRTASISRSSGKSEDEDSLDSETEIERNNDLQKGRRLRVKTKINYKIGSNSKSKSIPIKNPMKVTKKQLERKAKNSKKSKMILDSDEEESDVSLSLDDDEESQSMKKSKGLNLDKYKYEESSPKMNLRRRSRNSSKSKQKK